MAKNVSSKQGLFDDLDFVQPYIADSRYPGSPEIERCFMREQDTLILSELHPQEIENLRENMKCPRDNSPSVQIHKRSGWEMLTALTPPATKRGAVLIDPSYEETADYLQAADTITAVHKKWSNGIIMLWYPLLAHREGEIESMLDRITEGARAKLATVSSNVGGVPKLIEHGKTGYLFMPGDSDALSESLAALASSKDARISMGNAIYEKASSEFSTARTCQTQLEIYNTVLRRKERKTRHEKDGVVICGAYGHGNAGDEAILEAIIEEIRSVDPYKPITVLSRSPKETRKTRGVDSYYRFNIPKIRSSMAASELYINGGGSLIQDVTSRSSLNYYLYTIAEAKRRNCHVYMYGCGIGPVNYDSDIRLARKVINDNVDVITVREPHSMQELQRFGVDRPEIILTSDPAIGMQPAEDWAVDRFMTEKGLDPKGSYMCICLRRWPGFESRVKEIAKAAEYAYRKHGMTPVFLSINRIDDNRAAERVAEQMNGVPYHIISSPMDSHLTIGIIARMRIMVSMRLHGLIFAAGQGLPLVGLSYDPKVLH